MVPVVGSLSILPIILFWLILLEPLSLIYFQLVLESVIPILIQIRYLEEENKG